MQPTYICISLSQHSQDLFQVGQLDLGFFKIWMSQCSSHNERLIRWFMNIFVHVDLDRICKPWTGVPFRGDQAPALDWGRPHYVMNIMFVVMLRNAIIEYRAALRTKRTIQLIHFNHKIAFRTSEMVHWKFFNYPKIIIKNPYFVLCPSHANSTWAAFMR